MLYEYLPYKATTLERRRQDILKQIKRMLFGEKNTYIIIRSYYNISAPDSSALYVAFKHTGIHTKVI